MSELNIFEGFYNCFDEFTYIDAELYDDKIIIDGTVNKKSVIALFKAFKLTAEDLE